MSGNMLTAGYMAKLADPITDAAIRKEANKRLDARGLRLNYQGTMVIMITSEVPLCDAFGLHFHPESRTARNDLIVRCSQVSLSVDPDTITPFTDIWYNGTDSSHMNSDVAKLDEALADGMAGFGNNSGS